MKTVTVNLATSYDVLIGTGLLSNTGERLREFGFEGKTIIVTNSTVRRLHGQKLGESLIASGFKPIFVEVSDGEQFKTLETAGKLYCEFSENFAERSTPVLAFGGGVVGDLTGFVAATYMRGMPLVQIPTTLLAQVDSSIGGKVGVDHNGLKNMVGAFYQPKLVIADVNAIKSLDARQLGNGLAEIIKYGTLQGKGLFAYLEKNIKRIKALDEEALEEVIFRSVDIKARIVEKDEEDLELRHLLNYGHTIGHGIESASNFVLTHGEAVALGMLAAGIISNRLGFLNGKNLLRLGRLINQANLPTTLGELKVKQIIAATEHDKKVVQGKLKFVLARSIGDTFISQDVSLALIEQVLVEWHETKDMWCYNQK